MNQRWQRKARFCRFVVVRDIKSEDSNGFFLFSHLGIHLPAAIRPTDDIAVLGTKVFSGLCTSQA
jgi:hypothetical protein